MAKRRRGALDNDSWVFVDAPPPRQRRRDTIAGATELASTTFAQRLELVGMAAAPSAHHEDGAEQAGRKGEENVAQELENRVGSRGVCRGVRIPEYGDDGRLLRRHEIDVLYVSEYGLAVIEIKSWSGQLLLEGSDWVQVRRGQRGTIRHGDVLAAIQAKATLLREFLAAQCGLHVDAADVHATILFTNPRLAMCDSVSCLPEVVHNKSQEEATAADFLDSLSTSVLARVAARILPAWLCGSVGFDVQKVRDALAVLPTWDCVVLEGGKRVFGDLKGVTGVSPADTNRDEVSELLFEHARGRVSGTLWALAGWAPTIRVMVKLRPGARGSGGLKSWLVHEGPILDVPVDGSVRFRVCAEREDTEFPLNEVVQVNLST